MAYTEPRKISATAWIGDIQVSFTGVQYSGLPILDTTVSIQNQPVCAITWADKEKFIEEINDAINKYII